MKGCVFMGVSNHLSVCLRNKWFIQWMNSNTEQLIPPREGGSDVETRPTGKGGTNVYKTWYSYVRMSLQAIKLTPPHTRGRIWDLHLIMYKKWLNSAFLSKNSRRVKYRFPLPTVFYKQEIHLPVWELWLFGACKPLLAFCIHMNFGW